MLAFVFFFSGCHLAFSLTSLRKITQQNDAQIYPALSNSLMDPCCSKKSDDSNKPDHEDKGYVRVNGFLVLMTRSELDSLIEKKLQKAKENYLKKRFNSDDMFYLQSLLNGVFAAEGS